MSFRTEAGNVRKGLDKGIYKKPSKDFDGFADALSAGLVRADQAKLQEDIAIRREKRDEARAVRARAAAADKVQKSQQKLANLFMTTQPQAVKESSKARSQIMALIVEGGITNLTSLKKYVSENSKFSPTETVMQPGGPLQGPNMPVDPKISDMGLGFGESELSTGANIDPVSTQNQLGDEFRVSDLSKIADDNTGRNSDNTTTQAQQMLDILEQRGTPLDGTTGGVGDVSPDQEVTIESQYNFGPQPIKLAATDIKEDNWLSLLYMADKDQNIESIELIEGIAKANGWVNIMGQITKDELIGMPLEDVVEMKKLYGGTISKEAETTVEAIIAVKTATESNAKWWATTEGLLEKETNFLTIATGVYPTDSVAYKNINEHLRKRIPTETVLSSGEIDLSGILKEDVAFYDSWLLTKTGAEYGTPEGAVKVQQVMRLRAAALEKERLGKLADEKALSIKDQALNAWYAENGYFNLDGDPKQAIRKPSSGEMVKFENMWANATTAAKDLDIWESVDKIKSLDVDTLKMIVGAKLLPENSTQMQLAKNALTQRTSQADAALRDFTGENFSTTEQMDVWLASRGGADKLFVDDVQKDAWINTKAILMGNELAATNEAKAKEFTTSYAAAFSKFINDPTTKALKGEAFQTAMAGFERDWKDTASATPTLAEPDYSKDAVIAMMVKAKAQQKSKNPSEIKLGNDFMKDKLPDILNSIMTVDELDVQAKREVLKTAFPGADEQTLAGILSGTVTVATDPVSGMPVIQDMSKLSSQASLTPNSPTVVAEVSSFKEELNNPERISKLELSPEDVQSSNAMLEKAFSQIDFDPTEAFGGSGFFKAGASTALNVATLGGVTIFKDAIKGKQYMKVLNNTAARVLSVLVDGSRDSVFNKKEIYKTLPQAALLLTTDFEGITKIKNLITTLDLEEARLAEVMSSTKSAPTQKSKAYTMSLQLKLVANGYKAIANAWDNNNKSDITDFAIIPEAPTAAVPAVSEDTRTAAQKRADAIRAELAKRAAGDTN